MSLAEIRLWGKSIGAVRWDPHQKIGFFEYAPEFQKSNIQLSPLQMPLSDTIYRFPSLNPDSFHGLPGLLSDSLPDRFGNALIDAWLSREGINREDFNPVQRLCYVGKRAVGALEFLPVLQYARFKYEDDIHLDAIIDLANEVLLNRSSLNATLNDPHKTESIKQILQVGTSAGGARAKALIAWNPETNKIRSGQVHTEKGFEHWILKFDGITSTQDHDIQDSKGYGLIEYTYSLMAKQSGIHMNPCHLLQENGRSHFMTKRFDRTDDGKKIHMQSLCAMDHLDYNQAGAHSYEQAIGVMQALHLPMEDIEEFIKRAAFNILSRNQDDHTKNISFLMNKAGEWRLAPAYDVTYNYNPKGIWTKTHQMSINGKVDDFILEDLIALGKRASLSKSRTLNLLNEVKEGIHQWQHLAAKTDIPTPLIRQIHQTFRTL
ncbi:MAG: type II toxin-antitoxin system HipA family toxin [Candidatus Omnitrophica bacterium]|nr:type II toxin-antitoxin system HipA family toxin [Candidatus Omnitrophota bacterium]